MIYSAIWRIPLTKQALNGNEEIKNLGSNLRQKFTLKQSRYLPSQIIDEVQIPEVRELFSTKEQIITNSAEAIVDVNRSDKSFATRLRDVITGAPQIHLTDTILGQEDEPGPHTQITNVRSNANQVATNSGRIL